MSEVGRISSYLLPGWVIYDEKTAAPYIWRSWATEAEAKSEMATLLRYHDRADPWRLRLSVRLYEGDSFQIPRNRQYVKPGIARP